MMKILVVEDDQAISSLICMNLSVAGYEAIPVYDGAEALETLENGHLTDLALLDIMLPGIDGLSLLEHFNIRNIPVIFLTAKDDVESKIQGLKGGAEEYIVKPFEVLELLVRIEKVLERRGRAVESYHIGDIELCTQRRIVKKGKQEVPLKPLEYELLLLLVKNKNIALSREKILHEVWGTDFMGESRTVDVHVAQLRKKTGLRIVSIPKVGYRLEERNEA
ncbi:response regulator transcription factor [Clostridia bacterium OttesenSCG-928-F22]|nr:response regulator transcription factor [Clostridia bacterium OttesenSCG-928-F22]